MRRRRVVLALGGNAFATEGERMTMAGQFRYAHGALEALGALLSPGIELLLIHGNGPQVGHMLIRVEEALGKAYALPLEVCVAESEGELGYVLAQSLRNVLAERGQTRPIASLLTQVVVDAGDPAFVRPTKPIGPFYDRARGEELASRGFAVVEDAGRGFRRVVPSPEPRRVIEVDVIRSLLDLGAIVIAAGGGGVPVVEERGRLRGVDAVIDKDLSAALLAAAVSADLLAIVTVVPCAYTSFGGPAQRPIGQLGAAEARRLAREGHFAEGSMAPKIEAAARFCDVPGRRALITDPASLAEALAGRAGTRILPDSESTWSLP